MKPFHKLKIYGMGKIGPKGQVVIPAEARKELSLDPGEKVVILNMPNRHGLTIIGEESFNKHLNQMRNHFSHFGDLLDEYKQQLEDEPAND